MSVVQLAVLDTGSNRTLSERLIDQLADRIGGLGVELADIAGNVQEVASRVANQSERFHHLQETAETMVSANHDIANASQAVQTTTAAAAAIQDPIQKSDPRIVFCVAWAKGGYLPTHNPNYRLPQGKDPVWNNANCRNRRLFTDRAVQKVAANTKPFLLQTYRRDMGGGQFVLMKDLSSPIMIRGKHWGAFRMGFRQS